MATMKKATPKAQNGKLTTKELNALAHQKRGSRSIIDNDKSYTKKEGSLSLTKRFTPPTKGKLTDSQSSQLKKYMDSESIPQKYMNLYLI